MGHDQIIEFLSRIGIYYKSDIFNDIGNLSLGSQRKVQLGALIANKSDIILLDEPTNHIDLMSQESIEDNLLNFPGIVIAVSHDEWFIKKVSNKLININDFKFDNKDKKRNKSLQFT